MKTANLIPCSNFADKPERVSRQPEMFYGYISGMANLTCRAIGEPPADFEWTDEFGNTIENAMVLTETHQSSLMVYLSFGP